MTRTWQRMKEMTGKSKLNSNRFPKSINDNGKSIKKKNSIAEEFNKQFTNVGPNLASKIQSTSKIFEDFLFPVQKNVVYKDLTFEEFEKNFKSVKHNKAVKHDDMDRNGIVKVYDEISYPLEQLKVAKVSTIFKIGNIEQIGNYRPISVFPFSTKYQKQ